MEGNLLKGKATDIVSLFTLHYFFPMGRGSPFILKEVIH